MAKPFTSYDYDDAAQLVGAKVDLPTEPGTSRYFPLQNKRRPTTALLATKFKEGDHWQQGDGYIGQLPPLAISGYASIINDLRAGFCSENVIKEVIDTHTGGILGREPIWSFLPKDAKKKVGPVEGEEPTFENITGETLTPWWNKRKGLKTLQKATDILLCEGRAVYRIFFPARLNGKKISATNLPAALDVIYFQAIYADRGGVFTDPDTQQDIGIFLYEEHDSNGDVTANCAELSFLNDAGDTVWRVVRDRGTKTQDIDVLKLGGHLLVYEVERDPLITEQVQSNQRVVNLAHTMMMRNVNFAGSRQQTITNAVPPQPKIPDNKSQTITPETSKVNGVFPGTFKSGPHSVNFLFGAPIYSEDGRSIVGYTNPNINVTDPVPVTTFQETISTAKTAIYSQCHQRHVLIVDKADTSGRAREVARREYERSLKRTKTEIDALVRWKLETTLRLAAQISNQSSKYLGLRADSNALVDAGVPDPAFIQQVLEMRKPGGPKLQPIISDETSRNLCGVDDAGAELKRIENEAAQPPAKPAVMPTNKPAPNGDPAPQSSESVN